MNDTKTELSSGSRMPQIQARRESISREKNSCRYRARQLILYLAAYENHWEALNNERCLVEIAAKENADAKDDPSMMHCQGTGEEN
jgi:hypothetical protein